jgi:hypothetical protein
MEEQTSEIRAQIELSMKKKGFKITGPDHY